MALKTRKDPVISAAFTGKKLYCTVDYIGACCKERIQKNVTDTSCTSTHMGNLAVPVVFFPVARDPKEAGRQEVVVTNYALPASRVPDDAPGWAEARKMPEVKAWVAAHPTHWIILNTWHRTYMVLAEKPDAKEGLTVIFGKHQSDPTGPMKIVLVRPGTECHDCFKAFDGD